MGLLMIFAILLTIIVWKQGAGRSGSSSPAGATRAAVSQAPSKPGPQQLRLQGTIVHLIDVSGSTKGIDEDSPFSRALHLLDSTARSLWEYPQALPQRHVVAVVGSLSAAQNAICEFTLTKGTLFTPRDTAPIYATIRVCSDSIRKLPSTPSTDIRGALEYAGFILEGAVNQQLRGVILITDLREELFKGQEPASPNLQGVCVAVFAEITPEIAARPSLLEDRKQAWGRLFTTWGAKGALWSTVPGFDRNQLLNFFRSCTRQ